MQQRDRRAADELKQELKRLFELDRQHRLRNGAAETNLAALRERVSEEGTETSRQKRGRGRLKGGIHVFTRKPLEKIWSCHLSGFLKYHLELLSCAASVLG